MSLKTYWQPPQKGEKRSPKNVEDRVIHHTTVPLHAVPPETYRKCRMTEEHRPFTFYRADVHQDVCDLCNWDIAFQGGPGIIEFYPEGTQELLRWELARRTGRKG